MHIFAFVYLYCCLVFIYAFIFHFCFIISNDVIKSLSTYKIILKKWALSSILVVNVCLRAYDCEQLEMLWFLQNLIGTDRPMFLSSLG